MERVEIIAGLRSAVEKGYSLQQAMQSFINAGYNEQDVKDSARTLGGIITEIPEIPLQQYQPVIPSLPAAKNQPVTKQPTSIQQIPPSSAYQQTFKPQQFGQKPKSKMKVIIIILIIVLVLLIVGLVAILFFKEQTSNLINKIIELIKK